MSTISVVRRNGLVAIAADTLTKIGSSDLAARYKRRHSKLIPVGDGFLGFVGAGLWQQVLAEYFAGLTEAPALDSPAAVYRAMCAMHRSLKSAQFLRETSDDDFEFEETGLTALVANRSGIFGVFGDRSVLEFSRFYAFGSGNRFALGAMHRAWSAGADAEKTARAGVEAAAEFDENTALPLEVRVLRLRIPEPTADNGRPAIA